MYTKYKEKLIFISFYRLTVVLKVETIYNTKLSFCLKCRKNTENKNLRVVKTKAEEQCFYQTVHFIIAKNQNLLKGNKPKGCKV